MLLIVSGPVVVCKASSPLIWALLGWVGQGRHAWDLADLFPCQQCLLALMWYLRLPSHLYWVLPQWGSGKVGALSWRDAASASPSLQTIAWGMQPNFFLSTMACCYYSGLWTVSVATLCPPPTSYLSYLLLIPPSLRFCFLI